VLQGIRAAFSTPAEWYFPASQKAPCKWLQRMLGQLDRDATRIRKLWCCYAACRASVCIAITIRRESLNRAYDAINSLAPVSTNAMAAPIAA